MAISCQTLPAKKKNKMKKEKKFFIPANNIKDLLTDWNEAGQIGMKQEDVLQAIE